MNRPEKESQNGLRVRTRPKRKRMESIRSAEGETTKPEHELGKSLLGFHPDEKILVNNLARSALARSG
jgi:hypothetical protein